MVSVVDCLYLSVGVSSSAVVVGEVLGRDVGAVAAPLRVLHYRVTTGECLGRRSVRYLGLKYKRGVGER